MSTQPPLNRRLLPVPLETTTRSHRVDEAPLTPPESLTSFDGLNEDKENVVVTDVKVQAIEEPTPPPISSQLPLPLETLRRSHNEGKSTLQSEESNTSTTTQFNTEEITQAQDDASTPKALRSATAQPPQSPTTHLTPLKLTSSPRFKPQLIETTRGSRRAAQPYIGPIADLASPVPSDREDTNTTPTPTITKVVPHHKLTIWMPPDIKQAPVERPKRPPPRHLDGRSDLLTPHESRSSSLPPPLRPYRQGSMRPHCNTRMNSRAGRDTDNWTPTNDAPDIIIHGFGGDKQLFSADDQWLQTPTPSTSASDRPRDSSYSSTPSLSGSFDSSSQSQADSQYVRESSTTQHLSRTRESCDERYSGYLLSLAAVAAEEQIREKRLKEQVEESFPNRDFCYEPVSHWGPGEDEDSGGSRANSGRSEDFGDVEEGEGTIKPEVEEVRMLESDEESDDGFEGPPELPHEMLGRRESAQAKHAVDLGNGILMGTPEPVSISREAGMSMEEILAHEEKLKRLRAESTFRKVAEEASAPSFKDPFWTNGTTTNSKGMDAKAKEAGGEEKKREEELRVMREAAAPPMLGDDLVFRLCPSPQRTRCETDQRHKVRVPKAANGGGLWGGYCVTDGDGDRKAQRRGPQLLETPGTQTPSNEREEEGVPMGGLGNSFLPLTEGLTGVPRKRPAHSRMTSGGLHLLNGLDARLQAELAKARREEQIKEEFNDLFITQVYNYLSLGWPLLAREYDDELSKISGASVEELRINDANPEGNIGVEKVFWAPGAVDAGDASDASQKESRESSHGTKENSEEGEASVTDATPDTNATVVEDNHYGENGRITGNARWMALKSYIHEWARQHPDLENEEEMEWGDETSRRKGSWAI